MATTNNSNGLLKPDPTSTDGDSYTSRAVTLQAEDGSVESQQPIAWKPSSRFLIVIITLMVVTLAAALDATSLSVALPIMAEKLGGTAIEAFWSGTSFLLTSTVFQPTFASFSYIFGRKPLILIALIFFTVGSIVAAVANNFTVILIGRSIQGVGGGGIISLSEIILTDLVPLRERGKWFGLLSTMWAIGSVSGPMIGGAFSQNVSWRWIFWINIPFCAIAFILIPIFMNLNYRLESTAAKLRRVDWFGTFLFIASTTSMLIPITWGGVMYNWEHWRTLVPLILGIVGLIGFVIYEIYVPAEPLIRLSIFHSRTAIVNYIGTIMHGIILWCMLYYLPLYYEAVKDMTPILSGVAVLPQTLTVAPASIVVGVIASITGRFRWAVWAGWAITIAGTGLMVLLDVKTTTVQWVFLNIVGGLGTGMLFPSMGFAIQASATNEDTTYAVAMFSFFRAYGQSLGVAIGGSIFQNALERELKKTPELLSAAGEYAKDAVALVQVIKRIPDGAPGKDLLVSAYAHALQVVWKVCIAFAVVGLLTSLFTEPLSLDRVWETEHGLRTEEHEKTKKERKERKEEKEKEKEEEKEEQEQER